MTRLDGSRAEPDSIALARRIRAHALRMVHRANASHIGSCLSIADILAVLYAQVLRVDPASPDTPDRDRFVLSKGHATAIFYATLAERKFFPLHWLDKYCAEGSPLFGHVSHDGVPGVEVSTGSLGHGLPIAVGMALAGRDRYRALALMSDGECDEGTTWESALLAAHLRLTNLTAIIDYNRWQSLGRVADVLDLEPFADKWRAFAWDVSEVDGHDHVALRSALSAQRTKPHVVIAHTVKGKGVRFMEDRLEWHYRSPNADQLRVALEEVAAGAAPP